MTKDKILIEARQLFYDEGITNVRLQQIADKTGISVGNLAYHYNCLKDRLNKLTFLILIHFLM